MCVTCFLFYACLGVAGRVSFLGFAESDSHIVRAGNTMGRIVKVQAIMTPFVIRAVY